MPPGLCLYIFRVCEPCLNMTLRRELQNNHSRGVLLPLDRRNLLASRQELSAVPFDDWRRQISVLLVCHRIMNRHHTDNVDCHRSPPFWSSDDYHRKTIFGYLSNVIGGFLPADNAQEFPYQPSFNILTGLVGFLKAEDREEHDRDQKPGMVLTGVNELLLVAVPAGGFAAAAEQELPHPRPGPTRGPRAIKPSGGSEWATAPAAITEIDG